MKTGEVIKPAGAEEQLKAAQNFPQPEFRSTLPDIRMMAGKPEDEPKKDDRLEHEMRMQEMNGRNGPLNRFFRRVERLKDIKDELDSETKRINSISEHITGAKIAFVDSEGKFAAARDQLKSSLEVLEKAIEANKGKIDPKRLHSYESLVKHYKKVDFAKVEKERAEDLQNEQDLIKDSYENVVHEAIDEMNGLNNMLEHFRNPYPYESRYTIQYFEQSLEQVNNKLRSPESLDDEGRAFAKMLKRDLTWCLSAARVSEWVGPVYQNFFDGEMVLNKQMDSHTDILTEDFIRYLDDTVDGLELTTDERTEVRKALRTDERLGLREKAVELQDNYGKLLYSLVAVGQKNWEAEDDAKEAGEHYAVVERQKYLFLASIFSKESIYDPNDTSVSKEEVLKKATEFMIYRDKAGVKCDVKASILNPFCMDRNDEIASRVLRARLHELTIHYKDYFESDGRLRTVGLGDIVKQVFERADKRITEWESLDAKKDLDLRLTDTVARNINILERGVLASGDLGWRWNYEEVRSIKETVKLGPDGKPERDGGGHKIYEHSVELYGNKIFESKSPAEYTSKFWKLVNNKLVFQEVKMGIVADDGGLFYPEPISGTDKFQIKKIDKTDFSKKEFDALSKIAIHSFDLNADLNRIQIGTKDKYGDPVEPFQFIVKRKSETGGIYDTSDVTTLVFWARHVIDYDTLAYSRSTVLFPTIGWYREMWVEKPPYWSPKVEVFASNDHELLQSLGLEGSKGILSEENRFEERRGKSFYRLGATGLQPSKFGKFNYKVKNYIEKNMWAFVTPWTNTPGNGEGEYDLVMPMFLPTSITDINLWRSVTLEGPSGKVLDNPRQTVWHRRLEGKGYSELNWKNMDVNKPSWWVNNTSQLERWLGPLVTPHVFNRMTAAEVEKFYNEPSGLSEKEAGKRAGLSIRGNEVEDGVVRASVFAQNKVFASVSLSGIMGAGTNVKSLTRELNINSLDLRAELDKWRVATISKWVNTYLDLPSVVKNIDNYPGTAAQSMIVSYLQARKIVASAIVNGFGQLNEVDRSINEIEDSFH